MTYRINKTDGSLLTSVVNGSIDQITTDLTLIGGDYTGYGEFLNENLVHILENFSNSEPPSNPIRGQLWWDTIESRAKVYDGVDFIAVGSPIVQTTQPLSMAQGDLWLNPDENQLWVFDGTDIILIGPQFKRSQGISGFQIKTIADQTGSSHTVVFLYSSNELMGFISSSTFAPTDLAVFSPYQGNTVAAGVTIFHNYNVVIDTLQLTLDDGAFTSNIRYDTTLKVASGGNLSIDASDSSGARHNVDINGSKVINMSNTVPLMLHGTGTETEAEIITVLVQLLPIADYPVGTIAKIWHYSTFTTGAMKTFERVGPDWSAV